MDKRSTVNTELQNSFDGNLVTLAGNNASNLVELPKAEEQIEAQSGTVMNNFNVNVNVTGSPGSSTTVQKTNATQIVNNALASGAKSPEELKKNSSTDSKQSGGTDVSFMEGSSKIQLVENTINSGPSQPILDIRGIEYFSADRPSDYGYSEAPIKSQNNDLKRSYDILHFLTKGGISDHQEMSSVPKTVLNTEFSANLKESNFNYFESSNVNVQQNNKTLHESASQISQENDRKNQNREREREESLNELASRQNKRQENQQEFAEIKDGQDLVGNTITGAKTLNTSGAKDFNNLTSRSTTIDLFIDKMNSPPIWRTVLG